MHARSRGRSTRVICRRHRITDTLLFYTYICVCVYGIFFFFTIHTTVKNEREKKRYANALSGTPCKLITVHVNARAFVAAINT